MCYGTTKQWNTYSMRKNVFKTIWKMQSCMYLSATLKHLKKERYTKYHNSDVHSSSIGWHQNLNAAPEHNERPPVKYRALAHLSVSYRAVWCHFVSYLMSLLFHRKRVAEPQRDDTTGQWWEYFRVRSCNALIPLVQVFRRPTSLSNIYLRFYVELYWNSTPNGIEILTTFTHMRQHQECYLM